MGARTLSAMTELAPPRTALALTSTYDPGSSRRRRVLGVCGDINVGEQREHRFIRAIEGWTRRDYRIFQ
jgi:hypothetical protein